MKNYLSCLALLAGCSLPFSAFSTDTQRQADVAKRGAEEMPFELSATTHFFTKSKDGGTQRVIAKDASDAVQIRLVREHLREIQSQFGKSDFSGPARIHGTDMPGMAQLKAAKPGQITIAYREVSAGAELTYQTKTAALVKALHAWFDAQLADHGADAMAAHEHHQGDMPGK